MEVRKTLWQRGKGNLFFGCMSFHSARPWSDGGGAGTLLHPSYRFTNRMIILLHLLKIKINEHFQLTSSTKQDQIISQRTHEASFTKKVPVSFSNLSFGPSIPGLCVSRESSWHPVSFSTQCLRVRFSLQWRKASSLGCSFSGRIPWCFKGQPLLPW